MKRTGSFPLACGTGLRPGDVGARLARTLDPGAVKPRPYK